MVRYSAIVGLLRDEDPAALAARPVRRCTVRRSLPRDHRRFEPHHRAGRHLGRPIQRRDRTRLRPVVAQQHDRPREVRILHLRHREQQGGLEDRFVIEGLSVAISATAASPPPKRCARRPSGRRRSARRATPQRRAPRADRRCCRSPPPGSAATADARALHRAALEQRAQFVVRRCHRSSRRGPSSPRAAATPDRPRPPSAAAGSTDRLPGRCRSRRRARRSPSRCSAGIAPFSSIVR